MTQHPIFTRRARRDCELRRISEDEVEDLIVSSSDVVEEPDPGDPNTLLRYIRGRYADRITLEVTCESREDGRLLVLRVIVFSEDVG